MRKRYFIVVIILLSLNLRPAITSLGPLLTLIKVDLGMTGVTASLLTTLPVFCMGLFSLLAVKLSQRLSVEVGLIIAMVILSLSLLSRLLIDNSFWLILSALLAGMGIGIAGPLIIGLIKQDYPESHHLMSFYSVSMVGGAALASSTAVPLFQGLGSWQLTLGLWGGLAFLPVFLLLPLATKTQRKPQVNRQPQRNWLLMLFFSLMAAIFYAITAWLAPFSQSLGFTSEESGLLLTLFTMIQLPISFLIPWLVSRQHNPLTWLGFCGLSELIGLGILVGHTSPWLGTIFLGIGAGGLFPLALMLPLTQSNHHHEAISLSAFMQSGGFMFGSLGPLLFGFVSDWLNFQAAFSILILLVIWMLISIWGLYRSQQKA
ncbi:MFS transporter [uncultured Vagococcus sp.]|uniref:MFS transporter n=1 Tax=uncultured Vagococcus sp. TaxID=189676 RepID=UPI0028D59630|nr:MFS transporter [uncultured Vagococcus sp.]